MTTSVHYINGIIQYLSYCGGLISLNVMSSRPAHIVAPIYFQLLLWKQENENWILPNVQYEAWVQKGGCLGNLFSFKEIAMALLTFPGHPGKFCLPFSLPVACPFSGAIKTQSSHLFPQKSLRGLAVRLGIVGSQERLCSRLGTRPQCTMFGPNLHFETLSLPPVVPAPPYDEWLL